MCLYVGMVLLCTQRRCHVKDACMQASVHVCCAVRHEGPETGNAVLHVPGACLRTVEALA